MSELFLSYLFMKSKPKAVSDAQIEKTLNWNYSTDQPDILYETFDPKKGFEPKFQVLKDYYDKYKDLKQKNQLKDHIRPWDEPKQKYY